MEQEKIKIKVYYMYFWRNGKRERSPEYMGLQAFTAACGKWCDAHPEDYQLCSRIATKVGK